VLVGFALAQREQWFEGEHCYLREMCVSTDQQRTGAEDFYRRHGFVVSERMAMLGKTLD
jgi:hypothetical protein